MESINKLTEFLRRQSHNYKMMLLRSGGHSFLLKFTSNYNSIYITALGADSVTLGSMRSVSSVINMIISPPSGWISDKYDLKKVMGIGMIFYLLMVSLYAFAQDWRWILLAMALSPFTMALMFRSQSIIMGNALQNEDRATGFGFRRIISQIAGLISPIPAAFLVEKFGGLTDSGIRPMYFLRLIGLILLYIVVYTNLRSVPPEREGEDTTILTDFKEVLKGKGAIKYWAVVEILGSITWGIMNPFTLLYAAEFKGADSLTLGVMATAASLLAIILGVPINRFADSRGRKLAILVTRPFRYIWLIILFMAPSPTWLIIAWIFRGIGMSSSAWSALRMELVPEEQRGRWLGIISSLRSILRIPAPIIGGILYKCPYPELIFIIPLLLDMLIRMPLLALKVPEPHFDDIT